MKIVTRKYWGLSYGKMSWTWRKEKSVGVFLYSCDFCRCVLVYVCRFYVRSGEKCSKFFLCHDDDDDDDDDDIDDESGEDWTE